MSQEKGRQGQPSDQIYQDTLPRKSAEQGLLVKLDSIMEALVAIRDGADLATIQGLLAGIDLEKLELK